MTSKVIKAWDWAPAVTHYSKQATTPRLKLAASNNHRAQYLSNKFAVGIKTIYHVFHWFTKYLESTVYVLWHVLEFRITWLIKNLNDLNSGGKGGQ